MNSTDPFDQMSALFGRIPAVDGRPLTGGSRSTAIDIAAHDDEIVVTADLPGFDRDDIEVRVDGGRLVVAAERDTERETDDHRYLRRERRHESVARTIDLPEHARAGDADAAYRNGVLTVTIPLVVTNEAGRRIDVR